MAFQPGNLTKLLAVLATTLGTHYEELNPGNGLPSGPTANANAAYHNRGDAVNDNGSFQTMASFFSNRHDYIQPVAAETPVADVSQAPAKPLNLHILDQFSSQVEKVTKDSQLRPFNEVAQDASKPALPSNVIAFPGARFGTAPALVPRG